jgi:tripartite-type tricarboxylate transporter receptor subunit TctC
MNTLKFSRRVTALLLSTIVTVASLPALAAEFPDHPVRIVVPVPAGGPMDAIARALATQLGDTWKQSVISENRAGANEIIGAVAVAKSPGDGHTLMLASDSTLSLNPQLYNKLPYDPVKEFTPIGRVAVSHMALVVPASLGVKTLGEFIAHAKAHPGKIAYGSTGLGNITHLSMEWFAQQAGIKLLNVPFKGLAPVITGMLGNEVQAAFGSVSVLAPYIESGKMVALAISGSRRADVLPNVQTFRESGFPNFEASYYMAILAPGNLSPDIRNKISKDIQAITADKAFRKKYMDPFALDPVTETPEQFISHLRQERTVVENKVKLSGVKLD